MDTFCTTESVCFCVLVKNTVMLALHSQPFAFTVFLCILSSLHLLYSHLFHHSYRFSLLSFLELHFSLSLLLLVLPNCPPHTLFYP